MQQPPFVPACAPTAPPVLSPLPSFDPLTWALHHSWAHPTSFASFLSCPLLHRDFSRFLEAVQGSKAASNAGGGTNMAALELVAMDMKAQGMYVCRTLSFAGGWGGKQGRHKAAQESASATCHIRRSCMAGQAASFSASPPLTCWLAGTACCRRGV